MNTPTRPATEAEQSPVPTVLRPGRLPRIESVESVPVSAASARPGLAATLATLGREGLRLASSHEPGWYWVAVVDGVRTSLWVTEVSS